MSWGKRVMGIIAHDLERWRQSSGLWRMGGIHVALCVSIILITWPGTQRITSLSPINIMKPYLLAELLILSYFGLMLGSETFPRHDANTISPHDWVLHDVANISQVIAAKITGVGLVIAFLIVTTLPMNVLAVLSAPTSRTSWYLSWLAVLCETMWIASIGTMIRVIQGPKRKRSVAAEVLFVVGVTITIIWNIYGSGHFIAALNPVVILSRLSDPFFGYDVSEVVFYFISRVFLIAATLITTYVIFHNSTASTSHKRVTA